MGDIKATNTLGLLDKVFGAQHDLRKELLAQSRLITVRKDDYLWQTGASANHVWLQVSGFCQISQVLLDGRLASIGIGTPGDILGEAEVLAGTVRANEVMIRESASFLQIEAIKFQKLLDQWPSLSSAMLATSNAKFLGMIDFCAVMQSADVATRCAYLFVFLGDLCGQPDGAHTRIPYQISQDALASLAGTSRQTLNGALNRLRDAGIIFYEKGRLSIMDQHRLEALAGCRPVKQRITKEKMMAMLEERLAVT
ncbi:Crp/Fnr family transcriptional regulator [Alcanivorax sp. 1008]|uniref:Crp/Fnr family transcriptional regulator n=1 Tax=Alcanivorax sp. 1008 TaxID=2816853 RepID=UPI001E108134|nr:Crp/Fnr family transcriptional regulator [Alcanivorax sp. 1008]MCC1495877.1 Crp/Fnr family transcriptional regulator [Alcanivorax sp. 1008]